MLSKLKKLIVTLPDHISSKPLLTFIFAIVAMLLIWFMGEKLGFKGFYPWKEEESRVTTVIVLAVILLIAELIFLFSYIKNRQLSAASEGDEAVVQKPFFKEIDQQNKLLDGYLNYLKENWHGSSKLWMKGHLYSIPWYITLGDKGAGKSSLLKNSDLSFLLDDSSNETEFLQANRNFDWWISDDAVIIDPKGNLPRTGKAIGEHKEAHLWDSFISWLKVAREKRPLNGIIITLSVERLVNQSEEKREQLALQMRRQIQYLSESLGARIPVYFFITKLDVFDGFLRYFENISHEERNKLFGISFPVEAESSSYWKSHFETQYNALLDKLNARSNDVLAKTEGDIKRNASYAFLRQMSGMKLILESFLSDVFLEDRYSTPPFIRGIYFTSAYQQSVPLNAMSSSASQRYGISPPDYPSRKGRSTPYFTKELFYSLILPESGLASNSWMAVKRKKKQHKIAFFLSGVAIVGLTAGWWYYYQKNLQSSYHILESVQQYSNTTVSQNVENNIGGEYLPPLNLLRNALDEYGSYQEVESGLTHMGLYKGKKIAPTVDSAYKQMLRQNFMPALASNILSRTRLTDNSVSEQDRLASLRISRLIIESPKNAGDEKSFIEQRTKLVMPYMERQWQKAYRGNKKVQADLANHLKYALQHVGADIAPDIRDQLITTQQAIGEIPLEERLYQFLIVEAKKAFPKPMNLRIEAGTSFNSVFNAPASRSLIASENDKQSSERASSYPLLIPSFYTYDGYHSFFVKKHTEILDMASVDAWALGNKNNTKDFSPEDINEIKAKIQSLYAQDYARYWRQAINSLNVIQFKNSQSRYDMGIALKVLNEINGGKDPFRGVLEVVRKNTLLYPSISNEQETKKDKKEGEASEEPEDILVERPDDDLLKNVANPLSHTFFRLNDLLDITGKDEAYIDQIEVAFTNLFDYLKQIDTDPDRESFALEEVMKRLEMKADDDPIYTLQRIANGLSDPLRRHFNSIADESWKIMLTLATESLDKKWQREVYLPYRQNIQGRYPINKKSAEEISLRNFEEFFAPEGILESFYKKYFKVLLEDNLSEIYAPEKGFVLVTPAVLDNLKKAKEIRNGFFNQKGSYNIKFSLEATSLSRLWRSVVLNVDGQTLKYNHGPGNPVDMIWPNSLEEVGASKVSFSPLGNGNNAKTIAYKGSWSWFRLLDKAQNYGTGSNTREFGFTVANGNVRYRLRVDDPLNPLTRNLFTGFSLPKTLKQQQTEPADEQVVPAL